MGSGLVDLHIKYKFSREFFPISRDWPALGRAVSGPSKAPKITKYQNYFANIMEYSDIKSFSRACMQDQKQSQAKAFLLIITRLLKGVLV